MSNPSIAPPRRRGWKRRLAIAFVVFCVALILGLALLLRLTSARPMALASGVSDAILFPTHIVLGTMAEMLGASPTTTALQWTKAASHARSTAEVDRARRGIAAAVSREPNDRHLQTTLCAVDRRGSPQVKQALDGGGVHCGPDFTLRDHVEDGTDIHYPTRPPTYGPHYDGWYHGYGVIEESVLPGYWVHNLERGAVVLLYRCPGGCPDLLTQIRALYVTLPAGRNSHGVARLLAIPYADMDHQLAVVAWGDLLEFDQFETATIASFYEANLDRGPECPDFACPE